jgi:hypothetical protein
VLERAAAKAGGKKAAGKKLATPARH